jgi:hypothetical protein
LVSNRLTARQLLAVADGKGETVGLNLAKRKVMKICQNKRVNLVPEIAELPSSRQRIRRMLSARHLLYRSLSHANTILLGGGWNVTT